MSYQLSENLNPSELDDVTVERLLLLVFGERQPARQLDSLRPEPHEVDA